MVLISFWGERMGKLFKLLFLVILSFLVLRVALASVDSFFNWPSNVQYAGYGVFGLLMLLIAVGAIKKVRAAEFKNSTERTDLNT